MNKTLKVAELAGRQLDLALALALGFVRFRGQWWTHPGDSTRTLNMSVFSPSTNQQQGLQIIESEWIGLDRPSCGQTPPVWRAITDIPSERRAQLGQIVACMWGPTALLAAMRCKVASVFGEEVELDMDDLAMVA